MSTFTNGPFTPCNGPEGFNNINITDQDWSRILAAVEAITQLQEALTAVSNTLTTHIGDTAEDDVHQVPAYVNDRLSATDNIFKEAVRSLLLLTVLGDTPFNKFSTADTGKLLAVSDSGTIKETDITDVDVDGITQALANIAAVINQPANSSSNALNKLLIWSWNNTTNKPQLSASDYTPNTIANILTQLTQITDTALPELRTAINAIWEKDVSGTLARLNSAITVLNVSADTLIAKLRVFNTILLTPDTDTIRHGHNIDVGDGTKTYFLLGVLPAYTNQTNTAHVHVRHDGTDSFNAVLDIAYTAQGNERTGAITATVSSTTGTASRLAFCLLFANSNVYLAVRFGNALSNNSTGTFEVSGLNVDPDVDNVPLSTALLIATAELPDDVSSATLMSGLVVNQTFTFTSRPYYSVNGTSYKLISEHDLAALMPIGMIVSWWHGDNSSLGVKDGWFATDGRLIDSLTKPNGAYLTASERAALKEALGNSESLPIADNMMVLGYYPDMN